MQNPKVALYCLNEPNIWAIKKALSQKSITKIEYLQFIPRSSVDPTVNFVVMIFDQDFKDYDLEYYTNGRPDWREEVALDRLCREIQSMHGCFPNAKIFLVDCASMAADDLAEDAIDEGTSEETYNLHQAQWEREKRVLQRLRDKFFQTDYCVREKFRLTSLHQEPLSKKIADLIAGS